MSFTRLDEDIPTNVMLRVAYGGANYYSEKKWQFHAQQVVLSSSSSSVKHWYGAVHHSGLSLPSPLQSWSLGYLPLQLGNRNAQSVTDGPLLTHLMPCQRDNRMRGHTDCVFCLSSPLPPGWKCAQHTSCTTGGKTEEQQWEILIRSLSVVMTKPVRHFRCQLSNTRPPVVINSSRLLTHAPPCCVNWGVCTLLMMHSITSWTAGRLAAVNCLLLDHIQPHSSGCDVKAYLH